MKALKVIAGIITALVFILIGYGMTLPSQYKVTREITIDYKKDYVYRYIVDLKEWRRWGVWYQRDPNMTTEYTGPEMNVGYKVSWKSAQEGDGEMTITQMSAFDSLEYLLEFPDFDMSSTGAFVLTEKGNGVTQVEWSVEGDVGDSIIGKYFALFMDEMVGPDFEAGLSNLKELIASDLKAQD